LRGFRFRLQTGGETPQRIFESALLRLARLHSGGLRHLIAQVGAGRIVLGTDFPFAMGDFDAVDHLLNAPGATDIQRQAMLGGTAAQLLGIPSSPLTPP